MRKGLDFKHRVLNILPEKLPVIISALLIAAACIVYYVSYGENRTVSGSFYEVDGAAGAEAGSSTTEDAGSTAAAEAGDSASIDSGGQLGEETGSSLSTGTGAGSSASTGTGGSASVPVNINTADSSLLVTLNGIGQTRAAAIISYRERNGPFRRIEDIMKVPGIKQGIFNKIKNKICTE